MNPCSLDPDSLFEYATHGTFAQGGRWRYVYGEDSVLLEETYTMKTDAGMWVEHGPSRLWHPNGRRCAVGFYRDGMREGCYYAWYPDGPLELSAFYRSDLSQARVTWYYEHGIPSNRHEFVDGVKNGEYVRWYENGVIMEEGRFEAGMLHGPYVKYYDNGSFREKGAYVNGRARIEKVFVRSRAGAE